LFTPRDFDISPYFRVLKPAIEGEFHYLALRWADGTHAAADQQGSPIATTRGQ